MRLLVFAVLASIFVGLSVGSADAGVGDDPIVVIEVGDPMDQRSIDYVVDAITTEHAHMYILKIDSPGVSSGDLDELYRSVAEASAPVVSWIGPNPSVAYGGVAYLANHSDIRSAAPGAIVGYLEPAVQRGNGATPSVQPGDDPEAFFAEVDAMANSVVVVAIDQPAITGFVDRVDPALGQLIVSLDGVTVVRGDLTWELSTARAEIVDGQEVIVATRTVKFIKPGLSDRFLRLAARPETAFLFLLIGLSFAVFEFYAAGRGLMAGVASISLLLAGYGLATLPMWWPAVGILLLGFGFLVWGFAQNRVDWRAVLGVVLLLVGGFTFTTSRPAYPPVAWMVILAIAASVTFIWYSLTTVVRGRFATPTVGREEMLGRRCLVVSDLDPEGVIVIDGARWTATADRGVVVGAGAVVEIVGLTGLVLEVDPVAIAGREEMS
jgi:membrane-bound serine protease (ClpP class)